MEANDFTPSTIAKSSRLTAAYALSVALSLRLRREMGRSLCKSYMTALILTGTASLSVTPLEEDEDVSSRSGWANTAAIPNADASVSSTTGKSLSKCSVTTALFTVPHS